jgi:hypothetical protein
MSEISHDVLLNEAFAVDVFGDECRLVETMAADGICEA